MNDWPGNLEKQRDLVSLIFSSLFWSADVVWGGSQDRTYRIPKPKVDIKSTIYITDILNLWNQAIHGVLL